MAKSIQYLILLGVARRTQRVDFVKENDRRRLRARRVEQLAQRLLGLAVKPTAGGAGGNKGPTISSVSSMRTMRVERAHWNHILSKK